MKIVTDKYCWHLLLFILVFSPGCFLFSDFRKTDFDPGGSRASLRLQVPKGYNRKELSEDSAGNKQLIYYYGGGQQLYFTTDTRLSRFIDTAQHFPRPHLQGGIFYKGVLPRLNFWREVYSQGLRYGYRNVPLGAEPRFDSALNYVRTGRK